MNSRTASPPRLLALRPGRDRALPRHLQRRNALVEAHHHLVPPLAGHYGRRCPEPREDLIQVGLMGLIRAAELYRQSLRTPFPAFARPHIRGAILHYLRDGATSVRLPRRQCELQSRLDRLEETLTAAAKGRPPEQEELLGRLGITAEQWRLLRRHKRLCRPAPLEGELLDQVATPEDEPREEADHLARLEGLLAALDPRGQEVLRRVVIQGWSYRRTAEALEVSAMTVQRSLRKSLATLREQLTAPATPREPLSVPAASSCRGMAGGGLRPRWRAGRAPSAAPGWPGRHSPPPAGAPARLARS